MLEKYKHVIWDWNGTILNDVEFAVGLINQLLTERNLSPLTVEKYKSIFTIPVKDYYAKAGFDFSVESFEVVGKKWIDNYEKGKLNCRLYDGVYDIIIKINSLGIGQSVLSGYKQNTLEEIVKHYQLSPYFDHILGLDNIYAGGKMHRGLDLMKELDLQKGESLMIGDMVHDCEVAMEIGADCILLANGHQSREELEKCGVLVIDDIRELMQQ
jgi:phosphoglycolate phosphatase